MSFPNSLTLDQADLDPLKDSDNAPITISNCICKLALDHERIGQGDVVTGVVTVSGSTKPIPAPTIVPTPTPVVVPEVTYNLISEGVWSFTYPPTAEQYGTTFTLEARAGEDSIPDSKSVTAIKVTWGSLALIAVG